MQSTIVYFMHIEDPRSPEVFDALTQGGFRVLRPNTLSELLDTMGCESYLTVLVHEHTLRSYCVEPSRHLQRHNSRSCITSYGLRDNDSFWCTHHFRSGLVPEDADQALVLGDLEAIRRVLASIPSVKSQDGLEAARSTIIEDIPLGGKQKILLVLLRQAGPIGMPIEGLIRALWNPGQETPQALRSGLHSYISKLRRAFTAQGIPWKIRHDRGYYVLDKVE